VGGNLVVKEKKRVGGAHPYKGLTYQGECPRQQHERIPVRSHSPWATKGGNSRRGSAFISKTEGPLRVEGTQSP